MGKLDEIRALRETRLARKSSGEGSGLDVAQSSTVGHSQQRSHNDRSRSLIQSSDGVVEGNERYAGQPRAALGCGLSETTVHRQRKLVAGIKPGPSDANSTAAVDTSVEPRLLGGSIRGINATCPPAYAQQQSKRGRPRKGEPHTKHEPWRAMGISERTYYRRKAEKRAEK